VNVQALEIVEHRRLAAHQAGHATAALLLGLEVQSAYAPYWTVQDCLTGDPDQPAGQVDIPVTEWERDPRSAAIVVLAGPICDGRVDWSPKWPLTLGPMTPDDAQVGELVKRLDLDREGYNQLVQDAYALTISRPFDRLHTAISHLLEQDGALGDHALRWIKSISEGAEVEHLLLKATVAPVDTDLGEFQGVISTEAIDREKDVVSAAGMVTALRKWNRPVPLAWNHSTKAEDIFGTIDPNTVKAVYGEVVASGHVDPDSNVGREAWRSFKNRSVGFSFGYLITDGGSTPRPGGGRHITSLDIFEVTACSTPMNNDTRVLDTKALDTEYKRVYDETRALMTNAMSHSAPAETLRQKAERIAREHAPIQTATFDC
jgi:HK97 family phage prohead protease